jgi:hypothetical protein
MLRNITEERDRHNKKRENHISFLPKLIRIFIYNPLKKKEIDHYILDIEI